jgi:hypothetical protein
MKQLGFSRTALLSRIKLGANGKPFVANALFRKGKAFLRSAELISNNNDEPTQYVARHLVCQGLEIALKAMLLLKDYDKYEPKLRRQLGHNLVDIANEVASIYNLRPFGSNVGAELRNLNDFYSKHLLRYAGLQDMLIESRTIGYKRVLKHLAPAIDAAEKSFEAPNRAHNAIRQAIRERRRQTPKVHLPDK